jgi:hypothetical protein
LGENALQKNERSLLAHGAPRLVSLHDEGVGPGGQGLARFLDRRDLREDRPIAPGESPRRGRNDDHLRIRRKDDRIGIRVLGDADTERGGCAAREGCERFVRERRIVADVEHAECAGSGDGRDEPRVRTLEGRQADHRRNAKNDRAP